ncbi:MAG: ABC transporter permease [Saccharospirillaceae bacterium]|nr:ABC transporter permease [Pseudomonadales bacterium]NRB79774.1 ABC transporter permease [Saccharospirillaceae bacterium]
MHISRINIKRWNTFKQKKMSYYSLIMFLVFFGMTLFAELIANDQPLFISTDNAVYFPIFKEYSELELGGEFEFPADYTDPYLINIIKENNGFIIWPLVQFHYSSINKNTPTEVPSYPTKENWLGTDDKGRDVFAVILYGFRLSVLFGFSVTIISALIGVSLGALQGYYGGWFDLIFQRFMEIWSSMPQLFMLIILVSIITPTFFWLMLITLLFGWMGFVGVVRAEFLRNRNLTYVLAAKAMGMKDSRIIFKHILPNAMAATMAMMPFVLAGSITILTSLDFLGFGLPVGSASLGELLSQAKANLHAPWIAFASFGSLGLMSILLVFIGEGVRDAFDPRNKIL